MWQGCKKHCGNYLFSFSTFPTLKLKFHTIILFCTLSCTSTVVSSKSIGRSLQARWYLVNFEHFFSVRWVVQRRFSTVWHAHLPLDYAIAALFKVKLSAPLLAYFPKQYRTFTRSLYIPYFNPRYLYFTFSTASDGLIVFIGNVQLVTSISPFEEVSWIQSILFLDCLPSSRRRPLSQFRSAPLFSGQDLSVRYCLELISISRRIEQSVSASSNVHISNVFYWDNDSFASSAKTIKSRSFEKIISYLIVTRRTVLQIDLDYICILLRVSLVIDEFDYA